MIVCPNLSSIEGNSTYPNINWYNDEIHKNWLIVDETTASGKELAKRIRNSFPFLDLIIEEDKLVDILEWPEVDYSIDKLKIAPNEVSLISTTPDAKVEIDGKEYVLADGMLEYSNENIGAHKIILKLNKHKDTVICVEVGEQ